MSSLARPELPPLGSAEAFERARGCAERARAAPVSFFASDGAAERLAARRAALQLGVFCGTGGGARGARAGSVTCVALGDEGPPPERAARVALAGALFFGDDRPFRLVLALQARPKTLAHDRPLTRADVNSGVTYPAERLVLLWRADPDFWKVLLHEVGHLCGGQADEAATEARALDMNCALRARTYPEYQALRADQLSRSRALAGRVARADVGETNASLYWQRGPCLLAGGAPEACARPFACRPDGGPDEVFTVTDGRPIAL